MDGFCIGTALRDGADSLLRVFMAWKGLEKPVEVEPQELPGFERSGFTVVEWGGTEIAD